MIMNKTSETFDINSFKIHLGKFEKNIQLVNFLIYYPASENNSIQHLSFTSQINTNVL